jgi:hypothetical protein
MKSHGDTNNSRGRKNSGDQLKKEKDTVLSDQMLNADVRCEIHEHG